MARVLHIWDFDDTLAESAAAVDKFKRENPDVESWKWWHDPQLSTEVALETLPIEDMWEKLDRTPGEHWILSGRVRAAIMAWLEIWKEHPKLGKIIKKIDRVLSTSGAATKHIDTAIKKSRIIQRALKTYDEIHFYDDRRMNLDEVASLSNRIHPHYVLDGRITTASDTTFDDETFLLLSKYLQDFQNAEGLVDNKTYREVMRSTGGILRKVLKDMTSNLTTLNMLEYVSQQLAKSKIEFVTDLGFIAGELDAGKQVLVEFSFERKARDFYGHTPMEVHRAVHTLGISTELTFDRLLSPVVCKVQRKLYGEHRSPIGFEAVLWRME